MASVMAFGSRSSGSRTPPQPPQAVRADGQPDQPGRDAERQNEQQPFSRLPGGRPRSCVDKSFRQRWNGPTVSTAAVMTGTSTIVHGWHERQREAGQEQRPPVGQHGSRRIDPERTEQESARADDHHDLQRECRRR